LFDLNVERNSEERNLAGRDRDIALCVRREALRAGGYRVFAGRKTADFKSAVGIAGSRAGSTAR